MATPGFTHPLSDLLAHLNRLSALMRGTAEEPVAAVAAPLVWTDPRLCIEKAGWQVADYAFFHHVDVLRPYALSPTWLMVDEARLTAIICDLMKSSVEATADRGAVVCHLYQDARGLRICVSDSSGHNAGHILKLDGISRLRIIRQIALQMDDLGGSVIMACHPNEGVVVELVFPPALCVRPVAFLPPPSPANDIKRRGRQRRHT